MPFSGEKLDLVTESPILEDLLRVVNQEGNFTDSVTDSVTHSVTDALTTRIASKTATTLPENEIFTTKSRFQTTGVSTIKTPNDYIPTTETQTTETQTTETQTTETQTTKTQTTKTLTTRQHTTETPTKMTQTTNTTPLSPTESTSTTTQSTTSVLTSPVLTTKLSKTTKFIETPPRSIDVMDNDNMFMGDFWENVVGVQEMDQLSYLQSSIKPSTLEEMLAPDSITTRKVTTKSPKFTKPEKTPEKTTENPIIKPTLEKSPSGFGFMPKFLDNIFKAEKPKSGPESNHLPIGFEEFGEFRTGPPVTVQNKILRDNRRGRDPMQNLREGGSLFESNSVFENFENQQKVDFNPIDINYVKQVLRQKNVFQPTTGSETTTKVEITEKLETTTNFETKANLETTSKSERMSKSELKSTENVETMPKLTATTPSIHVTTAEVEIDSLTSRNPTKATTVPEIPSLQLVTEKSSGFSFKNLFGNIDKLVFKEQKRAPERKVKIMMPTEVKTEKTEKTVEPTTKTDITTGITTEKTPEITTENTPETTPETSPETSPESKTKSITSLPTSQVESTAKPSMPNATTRSATTSDDIPILDEVVDTTASWNVCKTCRFST